MSTIKLRRGTAAAWTSANPTLAAGEPGYETDTAKMKIGDGSTAWNSLTYFGGGAGVTFGTPAIALGTAAAAGSIGEAIKRDATILAFDATAPTTQAFGDSAATGSAAVAARRDHKHAMPATPTTVSGNAGTATALQTGRTIDGQTFDGTANITVIAPGTHGATGKTTPVDADELAVVDSAASNVLKKLTWANLKATLKTYFDTLYAPTAGPGGLQLVYRYTVTGSDKASIDTGVDTADAGSNDWTNGDVLEVWLTLRTDDAGAGAVCDLIVNNDTSAHYDRRWVEGQSATATTNGGAAESSMLIRANGAGSTRVVPAVSAITCPAYARTAFEKVFTVASIKSDSTTANQIGAAGGWGWHDTSAVTRLKIAAQGTAKLKVGAQLLVYRRTAS